jgi:hypothetical protein
MAPHEESGITRRGFFQGVIGTAVTATLAASFSAVSAS